MAKGGNTQYECKECGTAHAKWAGLCSQCGAWNSLQEQSSSGATAKLAKSSSISPRQTVVLGSKKAAQIPRIPVGIAEFDRVLGGGLVPGSLILLGGDPGIGKSTLVLQSAAHLATINSVLYASGEESEDQILLRADRLRVSSPNAHILAETNIETILATAHKNKPNTLIIDSIQTVSSSEVPSHAGSVTQIRYCAELLLNFANETGIATIIIGHVTKEGSLAGPRTLEHLVDTVLYLEGDRYGDLRVLRGVKNRFGSTGEVGIFQMDTYGLQEVANAQDSFILQRDKPTCGTAQTVIMEGSRPFVVEIQALASPATFGNPRRNTSGFDAGRLQLLIAILAKHTHIDLQNHDVYLNVVGGMKITERSADLAVLAALASSCTEIMVDNHSVFLAEASLTGELRPITSIERRLQEVKNLGIKKAYTAPQRNIKPATESAMSSNSSKVRNDNSSVALEVGAQEVTKKTTNKKSTIKVHKVTYIKDLIESITPPQNKSAK